MSMQRNNVLQFTADKYISSNNRWSTFLTDPEEVPKLTLLEKYNYLKEKINQSYLKGYEMEKKFGNRTVKDCMKDDDYQKFSE